MLDLGRTADGIAGYRALTKAAPTYLPAHDTLARLIREHGLSDELVVQLARAGALAGLGEVEAATRTFAAATEAWAYLGTVWRRLRQSVSVADWIRPPARKVISESPRVRTIDEFIAGPVCRWLIERARPRLARARIYSPAGDGPAFTTLRTNTETDFNIVQSDLVIQLVRARIAAATGLPPAVMELTKVLHYSVGERFDAHFDFIDPAVPGHAPELAARGQRLATFLVYLDDDYEGGETEFPHVGLRHRGRTGSALYFANVDVDGKPDPSTLHAGRAPSSGEKWLLSQWIRDRSPEGR